MKKKIIGLGIATLFLVTGCGKVPTLENGKEAVVTFNNGDKISVDELYEEVKTDYAINSLVGLIDKYVLEKTFPDQIETAKKQAKTNVDATRENYDSKDEFLAAIQYYTGMSSIEAYQDRLYLNYMQSHALEEFAKDSITDKQIEKYYEDETVGDIEIKHILITPETTDTMTTDEVKNAEKAAEDKAGEILKKLKEASKDKLEEEFDKAAKENSMDDATKDSGGNLGKVNKNNTGTNYDDIVKAAYTIKDGEMYASVVKTKLGYHVVYKVKSYDKPSLNDAKDDIRERLANKLISDDSTMTMQALQHYRKELGLEIVDSELKNQYAAYVQNGLTKQNTNSNTTED